MVGRCFKIAKRLSTPIDPTIFHLSATWLLIAWSSWFCFVYYEHTHDFSSFAARSDAVVVEVLMFSMLTAMFVLLQNKTMHRIVFSPDQVTYIIPFRKKKHFGYQEYPFLYRGSYFHGSLIQVGYEREYIVFAKGKLSTKQLSAINEFWSKDPYGILKIKYSQNRAKRLLEILPPEQAKQLKQLKFQKTIEVARQ